MSPMSFPTVINGSCWNLCPLVALFNNRKAAAGPMFSFLLLFPLLLFPIRWIPIRFVAKMISRWYERILTFAALDFPLKIPGSPILNGFKRRPKRKGVIRRQSDPPALYVECLAGPHEHGADEGRTWLNFPGQAHEGNIFIGFPCPSKIAQIVRIFHAWFTI